MKKKPLTNKAGEVRELTDADMKKMRPARDVLPEKLLKILPQRKIGQRGPQKLPVKISTTVRYSPEVLDYFKETGTGWQKRMDEVLREYIKKHPHHAH
jgi:uncharacterized protein (DUF4415 family)